MKSGYLPVIEIDFIPAGTAGAAWVAILNVWLSAIKVVRVFEPQVTPCFNVLSNVVKENLISGPVGFLY